MSLADGLTVARIRGDLLMYLRGATAVGDGFSGAFGIGKATKQAVDLGITSVPFPVDEMDNELWIYHRFFNLHAHTATENDFHGSAFMRVEVDTKAMRKLDEDQVLYAALQTELDGTATMETWFNSRLLFMVPS